MSAPAHPSLQGIPAELRNRIYTLVAAQEQHVVPAHRLVKAHATARETEPANTNEATSLLSTLLPSAVALHSLSKTCRQLRAEFQPVHAHASAAGTSYLFVLDNFDIEQMRLVARYARARCALAVESAYSTDGGATWTQNPDLSALGANVLMETEERWIPAPGISVQFALDRHVVESARLLCDFRSDERYGEPSFRWLQGCRAGFTRVARGVCERSMSRGQWELVASVLARADNEPEESGLSVFCYDWAKRWLLPEIRKLRDQV